MNINLDELTYGQLKTIAAIIPCGHPAGTSTQPTPDDRLASEDQPIIVVLQRGWVVVGRYHQSGQMGSLTDASVIRYWGTTAGLGELAYKGPLEKTKLDKCPEIVFHTRETVMAMEVNANAWGSYFDNY